MPVRRRTILIASLVALAVLLPAAAWGQEPSPILPGQVPEAVRPIPYWFSIPMALSAVGLIFGLLFLNWRYGRRFYGKEEAPAIRQRSRFAGMAAAQPAAAAPQGAPAAAPGATTAARAAGQAPSPPAPKAPPAETKPAAAPAEEEAKEVAAENAEKPAAGEPAPEAEEPAAEEKPAAEAEGKPAAEAKPAAGAKPGGPDQETFDRVLAEQLEKGVDRRVAEGRARAAGMKAAREKAGG